MRKPARCKTVIFLCIFIACVHVFLVMSLGGEDVQVYRQERSLSAVLQGSPRARREAAHHRALQEQRADESENTDDNRSGSHDSDSDPYENCGSGHIGGLKPICDRKACLERLQPEEEVDPADLGIIPDNIDEQMSYFRGYVNQVHVSLVAALSRFQWRHGIYGTLADTGVYEGKFTGILTYNTHFRAGENLLVFDHFLSRTIADQLTVFTQNMAEIGVHVFDSSDAPIFDPQRKVFVKDGDIDEVHRGHLKRRGFQQFRVFSIGEELDTISAVSSLKLAACVLGDGGLIIVNGIDSLKSNNKVALKHFFTTQGHFALSPFLSTKNKLYITTSNWKDKYEAYLLEHREILSPEQLQVSRTSEYGAETSYLITS